jgi:hypothetical protein
MDGLWQILVYLQRGLVCIPAEYSIPRYLLRFWIGLSISISSLSSLPTLIALAFYIDCQVYTGKLLDFDAQVAAMTPIFTANLLRAQDVYRKRAQRAWSTGPSGLYSVFRAHLLHAPHVAAQRSADRD